MSSDWVDGTTSAGGKSNKIKRNLQLNPGELYKNLSEEIIVLLKNHSNISSSIFPSKIFNILFTRTGPGMYYGRHMDVPYIETGRRDLSFTLFLNDWNGGIGCLLILFLFIIALICYHTMKLIKWSFNASVEFILLFIIKDENCTCFKTYEKE